MNVRLRSVALFAVALACTPPASPGVTGVPKATSLRLPEGVTLEAEALDLVVDPRLSSFTGTATLRVGLTTASPSLVLHGRDLEISRATVRDASGERSAKVSTRHAFGGREADEELVLGVDPPLAAGPSTITIDYRAPFAKLRGLYRVEVDGEWFAFTQLEAVDARRMFPSFDEPRFKAPFTLRVTVPNGMTAFANGALERTVPNESGEQVRYEFATTPPLPSYLVALAVGRLEAIALSRPGGTPIRLIATPGRAERGRAALVEAESDLRVLGEYFGRTYPYGKLDLVAVPDFGPGAMENAGLVTFREELLLADRAPLSTRRRRSIVLAHELAHQWFGDLVTMRWWDDLWLNEAFATWMAAKTCDAQNPAFGGALDLASGKLGAMTADALPSARSVRQPVETSDAIQEAGGWSAYQKGAAVLAMIERWIGRETFRDGIRAYVAAHPHGTVVAADLLGALDRASGKPVTEVATPLLERTGVPIVRATTTCTDGTLTASATLERPGAHGAWPLPICASQQGTTKCVLVPASSSKATLQFPTCAAIYGNADEAGYYRFFGVGSALRPGSEAERLAVLPNAWAQVLAGALDGAGFFDAVVAANLGGERSRFVLEQAIGALGAAMDALVTDDVAVEMLRRSVRRWLGPRAAELGPVTRPGEDDDDRLLRATLWAALWDLGPRRRAARRAMAPRFRRRRSRARAARAPDLRGFGGPRHARTPHERPHEGAEDRVRARGARRRPRLVDVPPR